MTKDEVRNLPYEIRPISMWGYLGYQILFALPLIGTILLIVFALGGTRNINLRNYARSYFCVLIIGVICFAVLLATGIWGRVLETLFGVLNGITARFV